MSIRYNAKQTDAAKRHLMEKSVRVVADALPILNTLVHVVQNGVTTAGYLHYDYDKCIFSISKEDYTLQFLPAQVKSLVESTFTLYLYGPDPKGFYNDYECPELEEGEIFHTVVDGVSIYVFDESSCFGD